MVSVDWLGYWYGDGGVDGVWFIKVGFVVCWLC